MAIKSIKIYSTSWCRDCSKSKMFLDEKGIKYENIDIEEHPEFVKYVEDINNGFKTVPTIVITYNDDSVRILTEPSNEILSEAVEI